MNEKNNPILYFPLIYLDFTLSTIPMKIWTNRLSPKHTAELNESAYAKNIILG